MRWLVLYLTFLATGVGLLAAPVATTNTVQVRNLMTIGADARRLVKDPRDNSLHYLLGNGDIYRVTTGAVTTSTRVFSSTNHGLNNVSGLAISSNGTVYLVANFNTNVNSTHTYAVIAKGVTNGAASNNQRVWSVLAYTEPYLRSKTAFDHVFNAVQVSLDGQHVLLNSGSRTDHGETHSGAREVPLTAKIIRVPVSANNLRLLNNEAFLTTNGYVFARGIRNTYDFAFAPSGELFGTDNGPDRDNSEEINWLREGGHFGFPWRIGGTDIPQRYPDYNPANDKLLDSRFVAVGGGYYYNDPGFPPPPTNNFLEPIINIGPDADSYRDPVDGVVKDASATGQLFATLTAHRSPLGLVFDRDQVLSAEYRGDAFVASWTPGDPNGSAVAGPFKDPSNDLLHVDLSPRGTTNYQARITRLVGGFDKPIDTEIVGNKIYVIEFGSTRGLWEVTLPAAPANSAPNIVINSPTNNSIFNVGAPISIQLTSNDADNNLERSELFADGVMLSMRTNQTSGAWQYRWTNATAGSHQLSARVVDRASASNSFSAITLSVVNFSIGLPRFNVTNGFSLTLSGAPQRQYDLLASSNLVNWWPITNTFATNGTVLLNDATTNAPYRFYKAGEATVPQ